jgi:hypothetical protein
VCHGDDVTEGSVKAGTMKTRHQERDELMDSEAVDLFMAKERGWANIALGRELVDLGALEELPWRLHCAAIDEGILVADVRARVRAFQVRLAEELIAEIIAEENATGSEGELSYGTR